MNRDNTKKRGSSASAAGLKAIWESAAGLPKLSRGGMFQHLAGRALTNVVRAPLTSLLTTVTIAIALFMFAAFILAVENIKHSVASTQQELTTSLYLKDEVSEQSARQLLQELTARAGVESAHLISKEEALKQFRAALAEQSFILEGLERSNPLPLTIEVRFSPQAASESVFAAFASQYQSHPAVDYVQYSQGLLQQVGAVVHAVRWGGAAATLIMLLVTGFIISNTIKLALYSHREEIEIMRLVGATDWFVRSPYLIEGVVQGFVGSLLGLAVLYSVFLGLRNLLAQSQLLQLIVPELSFLSGGWCVLVVLTGVVVGLGGSFLSVRRFSVE
ncbi:MAG: ABC transporter permease [Deltaproteobacteria bacterium]|nr:ABC transporter permease [Deltaproteobacteria bacterium]